MDLMIDLETLGVGTDAAVVQIGAAVFDRVDVRATFLANIDLDDRCLGTVEPSTVAWWMAQSEAARRAVFASDYPSNDMHSALMDLSHFSEKYDCTVTWAWSPAFDTRLLREAAARVEIPLDRLPLLSHRRERCARTVYELAARLGVKRLQPSIEHFAPADAEAQARTVMVALKVLGC